MKKYISAFVLVTISVMVASCQSANLIAPEYKFVKAPEGLYNCPVEKSFPKEDTLTDKQVGSLILKLQRNNVICKNSLNAVHTFYNDAEQTINNKK